MNSYSRRTYAPIILFLLLASASCSPCGKAFVSDDPLDHGSTFSDRRSITVYYATNRNDTGRNTLDHAYGTKRYYQDSYFISDFYFGKDTIYVPPKHCPGKIELNKDYDKNETRQNSFFTWNDVTRLNRNELLDDITASVDMSPGKSLLLFIHGYNTSFKDSILRTAQIRYDLGFSGPVVAFSWPSVNSTLLYSADRNNAYWSAKHLKETIESIAKIPSLKKIHLIAHSMGSEVLSRAIADMDKEHSGDIPWKIENIILCAPDIDKDIFREQIADKLINKARVTLYVSRDDHALNFSKFFQGRHYHRLGDSEDGPFTFEGITTIDASAVSTDFIHHTYFAESPSILYDIANIITPENSRIERTTYLIRSNKCIDERSIFTKSSPSIDIYKSSKPHYLDAIQGGLNSFYYIVPSLIAH